MNTGRVQAVCVGTVKGMRKQPVSKVRLEPNHGLLGDVHAGPGPRQVSLLAQESVFALRKKGVVARPGDLAENILTRGVDLSSLRIGDTLRIGAALVEVTEHGKSEWQEGDYSFRGVALLAQEGVFARVVGSGEVQRGDPIMLQ